jgi:hypothetical protein
MKIEQARQPSDHPATSPKIGVLLINLGTPDATDYWSMRRYLKEFLSDRRVIEAPRALWWFVLNVIILSKRPQAKGKDYDKIWNREKNEGPLKTITRAQSEKLASAMSGKNNLVVDWAMRYGNPSIASRLKHLQEQGCDRILAVPLYPQYAAATTATVADKVFDALKEMRWQPAIRIAPPWHDDPVYIEAVTESLQAEIAKLSWKPDVILSSFHGVPLEYLLKGDPYCAADARATWYERPAIRAHVPVAFRQGRVVAALHRQDGGGACQVRCKELSDRDPRFRGRLFRNDRGNRHGECRYFPRARWGKLYRGSVSQRFRSRNEGDPSRGSAGIVGLALTET